MDLQKYTGKAIDMLMTYGPKVVLAIVVLIVGIAIINNLVKGISKVLSKRDTDPTLTKFLLNLVGTLLKLLLFISAASMIGIETTSFIAVLSAMTLAVGMALQGSLSNFAGGALILLFRPIKVGELIEAQGVIGHVKEIQMFTTQISTPHNKLAIVPNGALANGNIINFSRQGLIRADINISIANDQNIEKARKVILDTMQQHPKVLKSPQPTVNVSNIDGGAVKLDILPCCNPEDYWDVFYQLHEQFYNNLAAANIAGPIPHRVIINKA